MTPVESIAQQFHDDVFSDSQLRQLVELLQEKCLAPSGSLALKKAHDARQEAAAKLRREKRSYFEAQVLLLEAASLLEDVHAALALGRRDGLLEHEAILRAQLQCSLQVYKALEGELAIAEASQHLLLPAHELSAHVGASDRQNGSDADRAMAAAPHGGVSGTELLLRGADNHMLGCTLRDLRSGGAPMEEGGRAAVLAELAGRLRSRLQALASYWQIHLEATGSSAGVAPADLVHEVEVAVQDLDRQRTGLQEDLTAHRAQTRDHTKLLEKVLGALLQLAREYKLKHQPAFDEAKISWLQLKGQTLQLKLKVIECTLLEDTYQPHHVSALRVIRDRLSHALQEAGQKYAKAEADLSMYKGVDPAFDKLAKQYREYSARLEHLQWTIKQVEHDEQSQSV